MQAHSCWLACHQGLCQHWAVETAPAHVVSSFTSHRTLLQQHTNVHHMLLQPCCSPGASALFGSTDEDACIQLWQTRDQFLLLPSLPIQFSPSRCTCCLVVSYAAALSHMNATSLGGSSTDQVLALVAAPLQAR